MLALVAVEPLTDRHLDGSFQPQSRADQPAHARRGVGHEAARVLPNVAVLEAVPCRPASIELCEQLHALPAVRCESGVEEDRLAVAVPVSAGSADPVEDTRIPRSADVAHHEVEARRSRPCPDAWL